MVDVISYNDVKVHLEGFNNKYLILGNGFSIALRPDIFTYASLFRNADLTAAPHLERLFEALGTEDFEIVIRYLVNAAKIIAIYSPDQAQLVASLRADAHLLKEILVTAIASRHPDRPYDIQPEQYAACRQFLATFGHIYTLNYDVLLYWALMQSEVDDLLLMPDDGFRHPDDPDEPYVSWQEANKATVYYLHGALHLFDIGTEITKYTWSKTDIPIVEQIRAALEREEYPLFVAEGTAASKREKIMHSAFLHKALRSFEACSNVANGAMVIFGHSLAANDDHILRMIERGKISTVFVSMFGDQSSDANRAIIARAHHLVSERAARRPKNSLSVIFFDAQSAQVWG